MRIQIILYCPRRQRLKIKRNGKKIDKKQNCMCQSCHRQFTGDHALTYKGGYSGTVRRILLMPVKEVGMRDVSVIEGISIGNV